METNIFLFNFIKSNFLVMALVGVLLLRIVPPELAGFWKYIDGDEKKGIAPKITLLQLILHNLFQGLFAGTLLSVLGLFQIRTTITFLIFVVIGFDLIFRHGISNGAVAFASIGILALYLERLI